MGKITHSMIFAPCDEIEYQEQGIVSKQLTMNSAGNITLFAFDKGQEISEHSADFDAVIHIIEGEAEIRIDGKAYQLQAGQMIIMPAKIPHAVKSITAFKMLLIMIRG